MLAINFGCGPDLLPPPWLNCDHRPPANLAPLFAFRALDVRDPLPFDPASAQLLHHSHLIEHLTLDEAAGFLIECRRILAPEGLMRLSCPDTRLIVAKFLCGELSDFDDDQPTVYRDFKSPGLKFGYFLAGAGSSTRDYYYAGHKMFWDEEGLVEILTLAGFRNVQRHAYRDVGHELLAAADRHPSHSLYLEARG